MKNIRKLIEEKNTKIARMTEIKDSANKDGEIRSFTDEELTEFNNLKAEVERLTETIKAFETQIEEENTEVSEGESESGMTEEERAFIANVRTGKFESRAMGVSNSGAVIPKTIANKIIDKVKEICPIYELAEVYNVKGEFVIPYYDDAESDITAAYVEEFTELTEGTGKFSGVTLSNFTVGTLAKISNTLLNNTDIEALEFIVVKVASAISEFIEKQALNGTSGKCQGVFETTNTITAASQSVITADELIDLQMTIPQSYQANCCWIMNPVTFKAIRKLKDQNGEYIFNKDLTKGFTYSILDKPVFISENAPVMESGKPCIVYGDMKGLAIKISPDINVTILKEKYATQNATGVCAFVNVDTKIANTQKIAALVMA